MRRLLFSLLAMCFVGMMAGCKSNCTHGVCDCEVEDHCINRAPWVAHGGYHGVPVSATSTPVNGAPTIIDSKTTTIPALPKKL